MKPDISFIDHTGKVVLIVDAKWKLLDFTEAKLGISQTDLYQMQAYANRYEVENLMLVYPAQKSLRDQYVLDIRGGNPSSLNILTIGINDVELPRFLQVVFELLKDKKLLAKQVEGFS